MKVPRVRHPLVQGPTQPLRFVRPQRAAVRRAVAEPVLREAGLPRAHRAVCADEVAQVALVQGRGREEGVAAAADDVQILPRPRRRGRLTRRHKPAVVVDPAAEAGAPRDIQVAQGGHDVLEEGVEGAQLPGEDGECEGFAVSLPYGLELAAGDGEVESALEVEETENLEDNLNRHRIDVLVVGCLVGGGPSPIGKSRFHVFGYRCHPGAVDSLRLLSALCTFKSMMRTYSDRPNTRERTRSSRKQ